MSDIVCLCLVLICPRLPNFELKKVIFAAITIYYSLKFRLVGELSVLMILLLN